MDEYSCDEILSELLTRFRMTNGIEFCNRENLASVAGYILAQGNVWEPIEECTKELEW